MLEIVDVSVSILSVGILRQVTLDLPDGMMVGLIGRNGAGKTTLMRSVMGLLRPELGHIRLDGARLDRVPAHARSRLGIGYMPEDRRLIPALSVEENLLLPAWAGGSSDGAVRLQTVYDLIPEILTFRQRKALQLSGGQQKLVALGRALMCGRKLLLLDEPFEGVAPALARRLVEVVSGLKQAGVSMLLSESDLQHSRHLLDRVYRIDRGTVSRD